MVTHLDDWQGQEYLDKLLVAFLGFNMKALNTWTGLSLPYSILGRETAALQE